MLKKKSANVVKERPYPWYSKTNAYCPGKLSLMFPQAVSTSLIYLSCSQRASQTIREFVQLPVVLTMV